MEPKVLGTFISVGVSVAALVIFFYTLWRQYRVDYLRERLFAIRDALFMLGAKGVLRFEDPAYGLLRAAINSGIQQAHTANMAYWIKTNSAIPTRSEGLALDEIESRWNDSLTGLNGEAQERIEAIREELIFQVTARIVFCSLPMTALFVLAIPIMVCLSICKLVVGKPVRETTRRLLAFFSGDHLEERMGVLLEMDRRLASA